MKKAATYIFLFFITVNPYAQCPPSVNGPNIGCTNTPIMFSLNLPNNLGCLDYISISSISGATITTRFDDFYLYVGSCYYNNCIDPGMTPSPLFTPENNPSIANGDFIINFSNPGNFTIQLCYFYDDRNNSGCSSSSPCNGFNAFGNDGLLR